MLFANPAIGLIPFVRPAYPGHLSVASPSAGGFKHRVPACVMSSSFAPLDFALPYIDIRALLRTASDLLAIDGPMSGVSISYHEDKKPE